MHISTLESAEKCWERKREEGRRESLWKQHEMGGGRRRDGGWRDRGIEGGDMEEVELYSPKSSGCEATLKLNPSSELKKMKTQPHKLYMNVHRFK